MRHVAKTLAANGADPDQTAPSDLHYLPMTVISVFIIERVKQYKGFNYSNVMLVFSLQIETFKMFVTVFDKTKESHYV